MSGFAFFRFVRGPSKMVVGFCTRNESVFLSVGRTDGRWSFSSSCFSSCQTALCFFFKLCWVVRMCIHVPRSFEEDNSKGKFAVRPSVCPRRPSLWWAQEKGPSFLPSSLFLSHSLSSFPWGVAGWIESAFILREEPRELRDRIKKFPFFAFSPSKRAKPTCQCIFLCS